GGTETVDDALREKEDGPPPADNAWFDRTWSGTNFDGSRDRQWPAGADRGAHTHPEAQADRRDRQEAAAPYCGQDQRRPVSLTPDGNDVGGRLKWLRNGFHRMRDGGGRKSLHRSPSDVAAQTHQQRQWDQEFDRRAQPEIKTNIRPVCAQ